MLHIITENNDLKNRTFPLPDGVRKILQNTLDNYKGDKTVDGYKRLNNILNMQTISYHELKRIKNFFDHYNGSDKSAEFILNGGEPMKTWVNNTLYTATKAIHDFKQAKKDAGISNAFIRNHSKDRQNKKKNKPTQVKFNTDNVNKNMLNATSMKYENIIRESVDIEEYYYDYGVSYVLNSFLESGKGTKQNWGTLINPSMYQKALSEFVKYNQLIKFPTKYIYQWMGIIMRNTCILDANTQLAGHSSSLPYEEIEDFAMSYLGDNFYDMQNDDIYVKMSEKEFLSLCAEKQIYLNESNGIHKDGQYDLFMNQGEVDEYDTQTEQLKNRDKFQQYKKMAEEYTSKSINRYGITTDKIDVNVNNQIIYRIQGIFGFLNEIGLYDWMKMPDGSEAWSDYGLKPIFDLIKQYDDNKTPEETLVLINKILDVYHQRGDLSSIFITGGEKSLSQISGTVSENKNMTIVITEKQEKMLQEAADEHFSLEELSAIQSFRGRFNYCTEHLGKHIGKGSSRATFQIDDEKVLKLAWNEKGLAQNIEEERTYNASIFPKVYDYDEDGKWIISEFVLPAKSQDFKHCFGMTFQQFVSFIMASGKYRFGGRYWNAMPEDEWISYIENNEDLYEFDEYIGNYGNNRFTPIGDMIRLCNYGLTQRNGEPTIVLLDSGLSEDVWDTYYSRK